MTKTKKYAGQDAGIGEIRTSLLKPEAFMEIYGPDWMLFQHSEITGLPLARYLDDSLKKNKKVFLPDARGRFLRMLNHGAKLDNNKRLPGSLQNDQFKAHLHDYDDRYFSQHKKGNPMGKYPGHSGKTDNENTPDQYTIPDKTKSTGRNETRPKNIAVNFFIKVR